MCVVSNSAAQFSSNFFRMKVYFYYTSSCLSCCWKQRNMQYQETVLCSSGASSSSQGHGAVTLHDLQTGSLLASFKQTNANRHSTASIPTKNGQGGFILTAQSEKSILNTYYFQKVRLVLCVSYICSPMSCQILGSDSTENGLA